MVDSLRKMLWRAFAALVVLIVLAVALNLIILQMEVRQERQLIQASAPLLDAVHAMDEHTATIVASARGYILTRQSQFLQQHDDAVRGFAKGSTTALQLADSPQHERLISQFRKHFEELRRLTERQIALVREDRLGNATEFMLEAAQLRRSAPDYAGVIADEHRVTRTRAIEKAAFTRQWLMVGIILASIALALGAAFATSRIEGSLTGSINAQVRRTETMIAGMSDGVMLLDREGRTVYINPAAARLLGKSDTGVPIPQQPDVYGLRRNDGRPIDPQELPAAQALATGRAVQDVTMLIARHDREVAISMNATALHEDGDVSGAIVTFRDVTQRLRLEEEMQIQAERAQILADAGAFFSSNIDPVWVTQAIAERIAELLGDWCAVIVRSDANDLRVASIYHRDLASLGLAWSYIYRQPLAVGEGLIGQVVATGYPSLTMNVGGPIVGDTGFRVASSQSANPTKLASLLILPLRSRREMLGALVIAANDPDRVMTDEKLPLAELLAERASLAIDNARLYTEQVDARRKVEDLSRLKDEFLSIASHELRTPVTSIKGYTQLAKTLMRENDNTTADEYLEIALDQIDRMSRLILELLDVSRIETGRLEIRREAIDWSAFVREVVNRHHTAVSDRRFHLDVPHSIGTVQGDRDRLEQVLGNLLENSVKYSPDGSDVVVSLETRGDSVITAICDHGIGIPPDELAQVFERFHRGRKVSSTNYGGLGLGLYITRQIIDRHGGTIWVESKEAQGTTFSFSLPLASPAEEVIPRADAQPPQTQPAFGA